MSKIASATLIFLYKNNMTVKTSKLDNTKSHIAGIFSLSLDSLDEVNRLMTKGLKAGGTEPSEFRDYGFMQQRTIEDPDGHTWELFYMDMSKIPDEQ